MILLVLARAHQRAPTCIAIITQRASSFVEKFEGNFALVVGEESCGEHKTRRNRNKYALEIAFRFDNQFTRNRGWQTFTTTIGASPAGLRMCVVEGALQEF